MKAQPLSVGLIGTGEMGREVANRILASDHDLAVYARRPEVRDELKVKGAAVRDSPAALARDRDIVLLYVFSDEQVRSVALDDGLIDAMASGSVLVIHTTGSPGTARALARHAQSRHIAVIDAPGSGGPAQVKSGELNLFIGGDKAGFERCRPLFESYARRQTYFGESGSGQAVKLINNLLFGAHIQTALEGARIAESMNIDPQKLASTLHTCSGQSYSLDLLSTLGSPQDLVRLAGPFVYKDARVASQVAADMNISLGSLDSVIGPLLEHMRPYKT